MLIIEGRIIFGYFKQMVYDNLSVSSKHRIHAADHAITPKNGFRGFGRCKKHLGINHPKWGLRIMAHVRRFMKIQGQGADQ